MIIKKFITAGQGLEPQYHPPEGCVLPLDEPAKYFQPFYNNTELIFNQTGLENIVSFPK